MPLTLPYFSNQVDPVLPVDLIPALYEHDEYQTYDVILHEDVALALEFFFLFVNRKIRIPFFTNYNGYGHFLVERFTPFEYPWCQSYSAQWFEFIKKYCNTVGDDTNYVNGLYFVRYTDPTSFSYQPSVTCNIHPEDYGNRFSNGYEAPFDELPPFLQIVAPGTAEAETIVVTYLRHLSGAKVEQEFNKTYLRIVTTEQEQIINLVLTKSYVDDGITYTESAVGFSFVVSSSNATLKENVAAQLAAQSYSFLASNFQSFLTYLDFIISVEAPRILLTLESYEVNARYIRGVTVTGNPSLVIDSLDYKLNFRTRNPEYYFAALIFANNNYWSNGIVVSQNLGKTINYQAEYKYVGGKEKYLPESLQNDFSYYDTLFVYDHKDHIKTYVHHWDFVGTDTKDDYPGYRYVQGTVTADYVDYSFQALDFTSDGGAAYIGFIDTIKHYA